MNNAQLITDLSINTLLALGWFSAGPLDTEDIYKYYTDSLHQDDYLRRMME